MVIGTDVILSSAAYSMRSNHNGKPAANQISDGWINKATMAIRYVRATTEAAKAIHLICWRISPPTAGSARSGSKRKRACKRATAGQRSFLRPAPKNVPRDRTGYAPPDDPVQDR